MPLSVEQESHEFVFGCVVPRLDAYSTADRQRYEARLNVVFNRTVAPEDTVAPDPQTLCVQIAERVPHGQLLRQLDQSAAAGKLLHVHVWGRAVGLDELIEPGNLRDRDAGHRLAELYTLCFAHLAVGAIYWNGFADGEPRLRGGGLLRGDLAPKYAFRILQKLIGEVWHTRVMGVTVDRGRFRFRGFFGDYRTIIGVGKTNASLQIFTLARPASLALQ